MPALTVSQKALLVAAVLVPIAYFGSQVLAAPYFPNFSVLTTSASDLGSNLSSRPNIFNAGLLFTAVLAFFGSIGLVLTLPSFGANKLAASLLGLGLVSAGFASAWAGLHPLPDPQHGPGALGIGMFTEPFVAVWAAWRLQPARALRIILSFNAVAFIVCAVTISGVSGVDLLAFGGLVQKCLAMTSFAPSAIIAAVVIWRSSHHEHSG